MEVAWGSSPVNMTINILCVMCYIEMLYLNLIFFFFIQAEDNVNKGKLRVAVEDFKAALALDPNHTAHNVHLHLGLCKVLVKLGRGKDALSSCTDALKIDGELNEALVQVCCVSVFFSNLSMEVSIHEFSSYCCGFHQDLVNFFGLFFYDRIHVLP